MELVDRALNGELIETLRTLRTDGASWEDVAHHFRILGFVYSDETWRRWAGELGLETAA